MSKPHRLRRQDPERTEPNRNPAGYFRGSQSWNDQMSEMVGLRAGAREPSTSTMDAIDDVVAQGVKVGYQVVEEYIRQGQHIAERLRNGSGQEGGKGDERRNLFDAMLRVYRDMAGLCIEAVEVFVRSPEFQSTFGTPEAGNGASASSHLQAGNRPGADRGTAGLAIEIASNRRAHVALYLQPGHDISTPYVHALHAPDPAVPPLTGASFRNSEGSAGLTLRLTISEEQPPGVYAGVVVDKETNEARGTLSVRVLA